MRTLLVLSALALTLPACGGSEPPAPAAPAEPPAAEEAQEPPAAEPVPAQHTALFKPLPDHADRADNAWSEDKAALGRMLYFDKRLSKNHDIACNSCHQLDKFGVDGEKTSPGHKGARGDRNSPTVYNAALHVAQFWDGRSPDVEDQAKGPVLNPVEMAMPDEAYVLTVLSSIPGYVEAFENVFGAGPITYDNYAMAVGAFERRLLTPGRFDAYLGGDASALTAEEKEGLDLFVSTGCATCHMGAAVGGGMYQKLGLVEPWETADEGRKKVTGNDADAYFFKVPSLRNIEKTGPYLHDGSVADLGEMVRLMAKHQLGKELSAEDTAKITTFLKALTGEVPTAYVAEPTLPESGPDTPKADPS